MKITISKARQELILSVVSSILTFGVFLNAMLSLDSLSNNAYVPALFFCLMFVFLGLSHIPMAISSKLIYKKKLSFLKHILFSITYFILAVLPFVASDARGFNVLCSLYFLTILINRICVFIEAKRIGVRVFNILFAGIALLFVIAPFAFMGAGDEIVILSLMSCLLFVMFVSLIDTLIFVFSRMKLKGILAIMKKTYAFEVLYGLVILIITSSTYFAIMEESIPSFADGLWYSFAVVTTIGFGDLTATSVIGRILSVVLGVYGLIVTAVITSIIVNFYNESKEKEEKEGKEGKELATVNLKKKEENVKIESVPEQENKEVPKPEEIVNNNEEEHVL